MFTGRERVADRRSREPRTCVVKAGDSQTGLELLGRTLACTCSQYCHVPVVFRLVLLVDLHSTGGLASSD